MSQFPPRGPPQGYGGPQNMPDPFNQPQQRYYDGESDTGHSSEGGVGGFVNPQEGYNQGPYNPFGMRSLLIYVLHI